ncbi:MAG: deiodinase-like protein [Actinomycetota bacterium]|nr:deiodinase-like protein [Actinomycetota bacterium]
MTSVETTQSKAETGDAYRYDRFSTKLLFRDLRFSSNALGPGDSLSATELPTLDGGSIQIGGHRERPLLVVTGSITCPMTASAMPVVDELYAEFGDRVDFVLLNAREAHPGAHFPQPATVEEKHAHARSLQERYDVPFTVAVDTLDGELHQRLDGKPNAAFLFDVNGEVVFRAQWARDQRLIGDALQSVVAGSAPVKRQSRAMLGPVARAMGSVDEVMRTAGPGARRDLWFSASPMATAGLLSRLFRFKRNDHRGIAAVIAVGALVTAESAFLVGLVV